MKTGASYFGVRIPRHVASDMKQMVAEGFSYVCHTFSENDMWFYHNTIKEIVKISHDVGLEVYLDPWGVGRVFGGEAFSNFTATNFDALQIVTDGKPVGLACPMNPKFRAFMVEWIEMAISMGPDMIFWDEPHFSLGTWIADRKGQWGCRCDICRRFFFDRYGYEMPLERTPDVNEHLQWGIYDFLTFVIGQSAARGMKNALCLLPHETGSDDSADAWDRFASIPGLNVFGTDPYFDLFRKDLDYVAKFSEQVKKSATLHNIESEIWFQGFKIPAGREQLQVDAIEIAAKFGIDRLAVWGFEACDHMAWIRPDDPERLWRLMTQKLLAVSKSAG